MSMKQNGFVCLVGAGPGGLGWLTLRGAEMLSRAEVVVFDRLVCQEILDRIPTTAERFDVGKESGNHPVPQWQINRILLEQAQKGRFVVRLKGGDSYLFGRGGEELELLAEHKIPFEVVPGVTSALAAPGAAGIPVTHRDYCSSIHIITGHARAGEEVDVDFSSLVKLKGTLVFLMGVAALPSLMKGLLKAGMPPEMPAAAVENGGRPSQRRISATVSTLHSVSESAGLHSPAVIIVGQVCGLAEQFDWFTRRPLFGRKFVTSRPKGSPGTLDNRLLELGAEVVSLPCTELRAYSGPANEKALRQLSHYAWVLFTSRNGVEFFFHALWEQGLDCRALANCKLGAVGGPTALALEAHGFRADCIPAVFDGVHLGETVAAQIQPGETVLLCDALVSSGGAEEALTKADILWERVPVYETAFLQPSETPSTLLREAVSGNPEYLFTSASSVEGLCRMLPGCDFAGKPALCIGERTAAAAQERGFDCRVSPNATIESMVSALVGKSE